MSRRGRIKAMQGTAVVRCAIYTRKSSEEGLEQDFNSLDAQREASEAYIASQKSSGWVVLADLYDDGGVSGGTMDRPALQRLLSDIDAGRVDTVVVYKVDRLTRSLSDFAKIVEAFDAKGVSFVSVTQQFNTTTSMGRLTLNILLSFAQFERDVTGERIRDKIAASKQKGMWMGGTLPLGYDLADRKLIVNDAEAENVRHIFRRYAACRSVRKLKEDLDRDGIVSKVRIDRFGRVAGGKPIARGALYRMLQNRIYRGEIVHKDNAYPGLHDAIIDAALWDAVQAVLAENRTERITRSKAVAPSLLSGLLYDERNERMSPTHANKTGTRYRYYVSQSLIKRGRSKAQAGACRVPAADLERIVEDRLRTILEEQVIIVQSARLRTINERKSLIAEAADLARRWQYLAISDRRAILHALVARIDVQLDAVKIAIRPAAIVAVTQPNLDVRRLPRVPDEATMVLSVPARLRRTGMATKLVVRGDRGLAERKPDRSLIRLIAQAHRYRNMFMAQSGESMRALADHAGVSSSYFTRVLRLSFLAPEITRMILQGRQPPELTANRIKHIGQLDPSWDRQMVQLGLV